MKQKIISTFSAFAIGLFLILITIVPIRITVKIDPIIGCFGLLMFFATCIYSLKLLSAKDKKKQKLISSKLTPLYKFHIPVIILTCLLFVLLLVFFDLFPGKDIAVFIVISIMLFIWLMLFIPFYKLHQVYVQNKKVVIDDFFTQTVLETTEIIDVERYFIFLYRIKTNTRKIVFLPPISLISNLFYVPKCVQELKSIINNRNIR